MYRFALAIALLAASFAASADTLVIVHPNATETITGTFTSLVIYPAFGQLDIAVDEYTGDAQQTTGVPARRSPAVGVKRPATTAINSGTVDWNLVLRFPAGDQVETLSCTSELRYFVGYPTLMLLCAS